MHESIFSYATTGHKSLSLSLSLKLNVRGRWLEREGTRRRCACVEDPAGAGTRAAGSVSNARGGGPPAGRQSFP
jgi:hypothetical protein